MNLEFSHTFQGEILLITPQGEKLDALNASIFKDKVLNLATQAGVCKLILNLSRVQFLDSSGLGAFLAIQRVVVKEGGAVKITHLNKNIQKLFETVSMHRILDIYPTVEDAVKSFCPSEPSV